MRGLDPKRAVSAAKRHEEGSTNAHVTIPLVGLDASGPVAAQRVERMRTLLSCQPGVLWAHVSLDTEMAYVRYDPTRASVASLLEAIEHCGPHGTSPPGAHSQEGATTNVL